MTGEGAGMAAGLATGLAIAAIEREEAEGKARRKSHMGADQVMLETRKGINTIGKEIASAYDNWYYNTDEEQIYQRKWSVFRFMGALLGASVVALFLVIYFVVVIVGICTDWRGEEACRAAWFPFDLFSASGLCIGLGIITGFVLHPVDTPVEYIRLSESDRGTRILLKIYDSDGRRNLDEDTIADITEMM